MKKRLCIFSNLVLFLEVNKHKVLEINDMVSWTHFLTLPVVLYLSYLLWKLIKDEAIFIPLPMKTVRRILRYANPSEKDIVYDLGCGDGRVVVIAAKHFGARAKGIEIRHDLVEEAKQRALKEGVQDKVEIIEGDIYSTPIRDATVVYMYLLTSVNEKLKPKLQSELKPGARVVSLDFEIPGWHPIRKVFVWDGYRFRTVYFYVMGKSNR